MIRLSPTLSRPPSTNLPSHPVRRRSACREPDVVTDSLDAPHDDIEELKQKVEAILAASVHRQ
jgi:hypothetical protein